MIGTYLIIYLTKYVYENEACIENEVLLRIITSLQEQIALDEYLFKLSSSKKRQFIHISLLLPIWEKIKAKSQY